MSLRYRRNPESNLPQWLWLALIGGGIYLVYRLYNGFFGGAKAAYSAAVNATTNAIATVTGQDQIAAAALGPMVYHTVVMPDGTNASIPSTAVDGSGNFVYQGQSYVLAQLSGIYYATATSAPGAATYSVLMPDGSMQSVASTEVSGGSFQYLNASYNLVAMPDGSFLGVFPSSINADGTFLNNNNGIEYQLTQTPSGYSASVVID
jgi:hypothetical protein